MKKGTYPNNVRRTRERLRPGMSQRKFALKIGVGATALSALENEKVPLSDKWIEQITGELGCSADDLRRDKTSGLREEAAKFTPEPSSRLAQQSLGPTEFYFRLVGSHLDELGMLDGDVMIVDIAEHAVNRRQVGSVVVAQLYDGDDATTIVRQYVPPHLLITNSKGHNLKPINISTTDCVVKGIVVSSYRELG